MRADGAQDAAAARGVVPPAPGGICRLSPAVAAQVRSEHQLPALPNGGGEADPAAHLAARLRAAARDRRDRRPRHEPQGRDLHPAGEPGTDDADPHAHIWKRHDTVSRPTGTASKAASTAMCVEVSVSVPVPRATSATALSARVTHTVPLSSGAPCAASPVTNRTATR